jgi:glycosyltransferase involved in cell wall biosynthesis
MKILVDASRNRSGGSIEYIVGVFNSDAVKSFNGEIHLFAPKQILSKLPDDLTTIVVNRSSWMIESNLIFQILWQAFILPIILFFEKFDLLFSTDASTVALFKKHLVMSQDMLSYEDGIMDLYPVWKGRARLKLIYYLQNLAFKRARGVIFLTHYAANKIQEHCGELYNYVIIPHGVHMQNKVLLNRKMKSIEKQVDLIYVSNSAPYKNQWNVVEAVNLARNRGYNVALTLVGGGSGSAQQLTIDKINKIDPKREFVQQIGYIERAKVEALVVKSDIYVFASSCENLPITLLEGMAFGLPIISSDRGPMPEVLKDGGLYFDPNNIEEITMAIISTIDNDIERIHRQKKCYTHCKNFNWQRTARETLNYIKDFE